MDKDTGSGGSVTYYLQVLGYHVHVCLYVRQEQLAGSDRVGGWGTSGHSSSLLPAQLLSIWALYIQMDIEIDFENIYGLIPPY